MSEDDERVGEPLSKVEKILLYSLLGFVILSFIPLFYLIITL